MKRSAAALVSGVQRGEQLDHLRTTACGFPRCPSGWTQPLSPRARPRLRSRTSERSTEVAGKSKYPQGGSVDSLSQGAPKGKVKAAEVNPDSVAGR